MARKKKTNTHTSLKEHVKQQWKLFVATLKSFGYNNVLQVVIELVAIVVIYASTQLWQTRMFTLLTPLGDVDPQELIALQDDAALSTTVAAMQDLVQGFVLYTLLVVVLVVAALTLSRFVVWRLAYAQKAWDKARYWRFLGLETLLFLIAGPITAYFLFGIYNLRYAAPEAYVPWAIAILVVGGVAHHAKLSVYHSFFSKKMRSIASIKDGLARAVVRVHHYLVPYALVLVPTFILVNTISALLGNAGNYLVYTQILVILLIASFGRSYYAQLTK